MRPGHTGGSVLFRLPGRRVEPERASVCLSGDVLFAGSIGRTDLPGGSLADMLTSLRDKILPLADDTRRAARPRPATTIGRERRHQPVPARAGTSRRRPSAATQETCP